MTTETGSFSIEEIVDRSSALSDGVNSTECRHATFSSCLQISDSQ